MKITIDQSELKQAIDIVSKAVPSRPSKPVLGNILLVAESDTLTLTGFDEVTGIHREVPVELEDPGSFTLPAKLFSDLVNRMPGGMISMELDENVITMNTLSGSYDIRGLPADDYPSLPQVTGTSVTLDGDALLTGLRGSLYAASDDKTRQVLCGAHLVIDHKGMEWACTDGHRMALVNPEWGDGSEDWRIECTIPADALRELERMLAANPGNLVKVEGDDVLTRFEVAGQTIITRLLEGQYPNYRQLMPKQFARTATIERKPLITSLERIAVLAAQKNDIIDLHLSANEVEIMIEATEVGSGCETLPCQMTGDDLVICFNVKYLLQALKAIQTDHVNLNANTPTSPATLTPVGSDQITGMIMPVQKRG